MKRLIVIVLFLGFISNVFAQDLLLTRYGKAISELNHAKTERERFYALNDAAKEPLNVLASAEGAHQIPTSFPHLSKLDVGEVKGYISIYYNTKISKILNHDVESDASHSGKVRRALETKLDNNTNDIYTIDYDPGPSGDPHFILYRNLDNKLIRFDDFSGTELIVPGDGSIYVSGEANNFFNRRRKYTLNNGTLKEVAQPYYYVGLKTTNIQPIDIYSEKTYQNKVAHLPANSQIEVLLASKKNDYEYDYLIKSPYGLVGWTTVDVQNGMCGMESIKGICFHGD